MVRLKITKIFPIVMLVGLAACSVPGTDLGPDGIHDPYESMNRKTDAVNRVIDEVALRPAAHVLDAVVPQDAQPLLRNAASNLGEPSNALNHLLQGDPRRAAGSTIRFALNSTLGLGGLFDPAAEFGLYEDETDFGETLQVAGAPEGAYVVLPLFGPSTERDAVGTVVDFFIDPMGQLDGDEARAALATRGVGLVATRAQFGDTIDGILYDSADGYAQARLLYLQNRRFELGESAPGVEEDPFALDTEGF